MPELLTTDEAASYLRLSERKLYELVASGAVACTKVTGRRLFPPAALDRWVMAGLICARSIRPRRRAGDRWRQSRDRELLGKATRRSWAKFPSKGSCGIPVVGHDEAAIKVGQIGWDLSSKSELKMDRLAAAHGRR